MPRLPRLGLLAALFAAAAMPAVAAPARTHVVTPADLAGLAQVEDLDLAADGSRVAYVVRAPGKGRALGPSRIWTVPAAGREPARPLPQGHDGERAPRWSPDGRALAFLFDPGADKPAQLWLAAPYTAPPRQLVALPGAAMALRWSPDGRFIAVTVKGKPNPPEPASGAIEVDRHPAASRLYLVDVAHGTARPLGAPDAVVFDFDWSPDGRRLVARLGEDPGIESFWYRSRIALLDLDGREVQVIDRHATAMHPGFSPDGRSLVYERFNDSGITGTLMVRDLASPAGRAIGAEWPGSLRSAQWSRDGRSLVALGLEHTGAVFLRIDAASGKVAATLGRAQGDLFEFSLAGDGSVAFLGQAADQPGEVWLLAQGQARPLTQTNPQVRQWRLGSVREVNWRDRDGTPLYGVLVLPPDARPGQPLPTLVQLHGGPLDAWWSGWLGSWHEWAQMLASHGYAVFMPNPRGSEGQGRAFAEANARDWGGADFQDVLDGVAMLERERIADPARLAVGGWSYGGFLSAWAATHAGPFKTAIVGAGVTDIAGMELTSDVGRSFIRPYFGDPLAQHALYRAHSPLSYAGDPGIHMPVLILQGDADTRVPPFQAQMFYQALKSAGRTVEMVRYPGGPHWFGGAVGPAYLEDVPRRVLGWLQAQLGDPAARRAGAER
jgi:dipeptidyl aminopeptidase/acylaminoacyl peptidase